MLLTYLFPFFVTKKKNKQTHTQSQEEKREKTDLGRVYGDYSVEKIRVVENGSPGEDCD